MLDQRESAGPEAAGGPGTAAAVAGSSPSSPAASPPPENPLLAGRVDSVPEVLTRMTQIQDHIEAREPLGPRDGVACFNFLYRIITSNVLAKIGTGFFHDDHFLTRLDVAFANLYFDALRANELDPETVPSSWEALIERRSEERVTALQFAVAGVNAHINFDLCRAVVATCEELDREPDFGSQRRDYDRVNGIFAEEMERLRQHFEGRLALWVDENILLHVDDAIGNWSVEAARDTAWEYAELLWAVRDLEFAERQLVKNLDRLVGLVGRGLLVRVP